MTYANDARGRLRLLGRVMKIQLHWTRLVVAPLDSSRLEEHNGTLGLKFYYDIGRGLTFSCQHTDAPATIVYAPPPEWRCIDYLSLERAPRLLG